MSHFKKNTNSRSVTQSSDGTEYNTLGNNFSTQLRTKERQRHHHIRATILLWIIYTFLHQHRQLFIVALLTSTATHVIYIPTSQFQSHIQSEWSQ